MKIRRRLIVEMQLLMLEGRQQLFDVALHVEERVRLRRRMDALGERIAGGDKPQVAALVVAIAQLLEDLAGFEQAHVGVAAIQVVTHHVQQAGQQRGAHVARLFAQRIGDGQRLASGAPPKPFCLGGVPKVLASCSEMKVIEMLSS